MANTYDNVDFDYATAMADRAMRAMEAHRVPPTPDNFEVWFDYSRGVSTNLKKTIDILIGNRRKFDASVNRELYLTFAKSRMGGEEAARELSGQIQALVSGARELLHAAASDSRAQALEVGEMSSQLMNGNAQAVIARLVDELSKAAVRASGLEASFARSSKEIDEIRESLRVAETRSNTDTLTNLANRRLLDEFLRNAQIAAMERGEPLSVFLVDVDHFKSFNDQFGHQVGDQVLRQVARVMQDKVRQADLAARYGGEELMAVLPGADLHACHEVAERVRGTIELCRITRRATGEALPGVTVSIGAAQFRPGEALEKLIARCDEALYAAKHAGRNRTVLETELANAPAPTALAETAAARPH